MLKRFMLIAFILMLVLAACASPTPPPAPTASADTVPPTPARRRKCRRGYRPPLRPSSLLPRPHLRPLFVTPSTPANSA